MKKVYKRKSNLEPAQEKQDNPDIAAVIGNMQQQLAILGEKIDTLISQSQGGSSGERHYSKPYQSFDRPRRFGRDNQDSRFRERSFTRAVCAECGQECEVPFRPTGDRPVYCKDCFSKRKDSGAPESHFAKHRGGASRRPGEGKRPNFRRQRTRD